MKHMNHEYMKHEYTKEINHLQSMLLQILAELLLVNYDMVDHLLSIMTW